MGKSTPSPTAEQTAASTPGRAPQRRLRVVPPTALWPPGRRLIIAASAAGVCVLATAALLLATSLAGPGNGQRAGASSRLGSAAGTARGSTPGKTGTSASTPPVARQSAAAGSTPGAIAAWSNGSGMTALRALRVQVTGMLAAVQTGNMTTSAKACSQLGVAMANAAAAPAIPQKSAQTWYSEALAQFGEAVSECDAGTVSNDASVLAGAQAAARRGANDLEEVYALLPALND